MSLAKAQRREDSVLESICDFTPGEAIPWDLREPHFSDYSEVFNIEFSRF